LLCTPFSDPPRAGFRYALDNGAWRAYQQGIEFDVCRFETLVAKWGDYADWIVLPDMVAGGVDSLEFSMEWVDRIEGQRLLAVQDGMTAAHVRPHIGRDVGLFVGGTTEFKEQTLSEWGVLAREVGCWLHVGRVNTKRRISLCASAGATSFDGSGVSRFAKTIPFIDAARRQLAFEELEK
jgi:hypothetical protein